MEKKRNYKILGAVNLIKFVLVALVFVIHWYLHYNFTDFGSITLEHLVHAGDFTMTCFFILSGFVLYHVYHNADFSNPEYLKNFYARRLIKILPSYFFVLIINCILEYIHCGFNTPVNYLIHFTASQSFFPKQFLLEFCTPGLWFITVILFLYFLFPLLSVLVKGFKNLFLLFLAVYILGIIPDIVACWYFDVKDFFFNPVFRICQFMCGIIFAQLYVRHNEEKQIYPLYALLLTFVMVFAISYIYPFKFFNGVPFEKHGIFYDIVVLPLFPAILYFFAKSTGKIFHLLTDNIIVNFLGNIAYAFFLVQTIIQTVMWYWVKPADYFGYSPDTVLIVCFIINIFLALPVYGIEKLFAKLLRKN